MASPEKPMQCPVCTEPQMGYLDGGEDGPYYAVESRKCDDNACITRLCEDCEDNGKAHQCDLCGGLFCLKHIVLHGITWLCSACADWPEELA